MAPLKNLKMFKNVKCRNAASVTLTCDFIVTELHHGHILRNVPSPFSGNLFHKIALTTCKECLIDL